MSTKNGIDSFVYAPRYFHNQRLLLRGKIEEFLFYNDILIDKFFE